MGYVRVYTHQKWIQLVFAYMDGQNIGMSFVEEFYHTKIFVICCANGGNFENLNDLISANKYQFNYLSGNIFQQMYWLT